MEMEIGKVENLLNFRLPNFKNLDLEDLRDTFKGILDSLSQKDAFIRD